MNFFKNNQNQILSTESTDERYLEFLSKGGYIEISENEYNELANPKPSLDELKASKLAEVKSIANKFDEFKCDDLFVTSSLGFRANADARSQRNIEKLISIGKDADYKSYDDVFVPVNIAQLQILLNECVLNGLDLYHQKWLYETAINNAKNKTELGKIKIKFEMKDFSK